MHRLALLVLLAIPVPAAALTTPRTGGYVHAGGGGLLAVPPLSGGFGWQAGAGFWRGAYDDEYSLGRFWAGGIGVRQDLRDGPHTAVVVELRRGVDILVVGWHGFLAAGAVIGERPGLLAEAGVGAKGRFRFSGPFVGWQVRLNVGAELVDEAVAGRAMLTAGVELAAPFQRRETP